MNAKRKRHPHPYEVEITAIMAAILFRLVGTTLPAEHRTGLAAELAVDLFQTVRKKVEDG